MDKAKRALVIFAVFAALIVVAAGLSFLIPWLGAATEMPELVELSVLSDGAGEYTLSWSEAEGVTEYRIGIAEAGEEGELLSEFDVSGSSAELTGLPEGRELSITVTPLGRWRSFVGGEFLRPGRNPAAGHVVLSPLELKDVEYVIDDTAQTLSVSAEPGSGRRYELVQVTGDGEQRLSIGTGTQSVSFGEGGSLPMPEYGEEYTFTVRAVEHFEGCMLIGEAGESVTVDRESLLPGVLELECEDLGGNSYSLSWNETKGGGYEVQQLVGDTWETLSSVERDGERVYLTGMLPSCREQTFRVVTVGGAIPEGAEYAAEPAEVNFRTELSSLYCTIWPLTELTLYKEADSASEALGTIPAGSTLCVLAEEDGLFRVRYDGRYGYIDSRYCLINLPEYLGDLISYYITNSYASLYAVHGYEIPKVTGTVIVGYEHVRLAEGVYLAPYLYPCCEKLYTAANSAIEQGYRLKIYDSYRPNRATRDIYDKAEVLANEPVPELDIYGEVPEDLPELAEGEVLTYIRLWEEGSYGLPNFLAQHGSAHNMGIALDLTIETLEGKELEMQTDMHDLSVYSTIWHDNSEALVLESIMKDAGFGGLTSEWWHFQDNETRDALSLNIYMYNGVSAEGWIADDTGWRYRRADGSFVTGSAEIGGVSYDFGEDGYSELWPDQSAEG